MLIQGEAKVAGGQGGACQAPGHGKGLALSRYPEGALRGIKGSKDPRAVVAYAKFQDLFYELDPMAKTNKYQYSKEDKAMLDALADNVVLPVANYKTSSMNTYGILWDIYRVAQGGGDFSKTISDNKDAFDACIKSALKQ